MNQARLNIPKAEFANGRGAYLPSQWSAMQGLLTERSRAIESTDQAEKLKIPALTNKLRSLGLIK